MKIRKYMTAVMVTITLCLPSLASAGYTDTRYPIVLAHGLFGFDDIAGYGYWYQIPAALRRSGADVHVTQVASANATEIRGEQLARQVESILATTGASKVNLIGHSHGGPTVRYVASVYPQYVASVTSVAGPNKGALAADAIIGVTGALPNNGALIGKVLDTFFSGFIDFISGGGYDQDTLAAVNSLTTTSMNAFNQSYPEGVPQSRCGQTAEVASNGVRYFSWSGAKPFTNFFDPLDYALSTISLLYTVQGQRSDGLVGACSSHLGNVIRDNYRMNHLDEVNQIAGLTYLWETDPVTVYRQQANRLKNRGL